MTGCHQHTFCVSGFHVCWPDWVQNGHHFSSDLVLSMRAGITWFPFFNDSIASVSTARNSAGKASDKVHK